MRVNIDIALHLRYHSGIFTFEFAARLFILKGFHEMNNRINNHTIMSDHEINHHIDRFKESFLCAAARGGRIEECASLISFGANVDWRENGNEDNPLLVAVRNSMQDVAALLLAHGANPTVRDRDGNTVMHLAAANGDECMASLFSPNASDLSLSTNKDGMTGN
jgi:ankyrin repeat protein